MTQSPTVSAMHPDPDLTKNSLNEVPADNRQDSSLRAFYFVLLPGFSLLALAGALDVLRAANIDAGNTLYSWRLLSPGNDAVKVESSGGIELQAERLLDCQIKKVPDNSVIAVCGGEGSHSFRNTDLSSWLKQAAKRDVHIGSISDGAFVLADCGLFYAHRSTIHWKCLDAYRRLYPDLDSRVTMLEIDRQRFSCAGGTASLDLFLHFVHEDQGFDSVAKITKNYFHDTLRDNSTGQHMAEAYRYASRSKALAEALRIMTSNIEQPLSISDIAERSGTTQRSIDRLFKRHLGQSPAKYYRELRLARAASLLQQTGLPVAEIALSCGFSTASHLGQHFREFSGKTPGEFRNRHQKTIRDSNTV